ncbi:MAG: DAK2 domain-containing protein, partial [Oscillospiraceae bacterium]
LEGMYRVISGGEMILSDDEVKPVTPAAVAAADAPAKEQRFGYETEFVVNKADSSKDATALRAYLETIGDGLTVVDDDNIIRVHLCTDHPGKALEGGIKFGTLSKVKVDNIRERQDSIIKADVSAQSNRKQPVPPEKDIGFVAVAAGAGIEALFRDLGADSIVRGGQTMNPSTEDILEAVGQTPAHNVFVLPNNKNIIMAAEQAVHLADRNVCVLQSKTIPQGISAMMAFNPDGSFEENRSYMTDALGMVGSGQITYAVRDSEYDGHKIKQGEILAMDNGKIVFTEKDVTKALVKLTKRLTTASSSYITVLYGSDVTDEDANAAYEALRAKISDSIDIVLVNGGQPVYYYIISVE